MEKNTFEKELREKRNKKPILNVSFKEDVLKGLWYHDEFSLREYVGKTATNEDFKKVVGLKENGEARKKVYGIIKEKII